MKQAQPILARREERAGSASRRVAYYSLAHAAFTCLAGSFEMPMALRLIGKMELVALVYAFYYTTVFVGFALGLFLLREGRASLLFRLDLLLLASLAAGAALFFPAFRGLGALALYFIVRGLSEGIYWSARHRSLIWSLRDGARDDFVLKLQTLSVLLAVLLPLLSGAAVSFIDLGGGGLASARNPLLPGGYVPVFALTGLLLFIALLASPSLRIGRSPVSPRAALSLRRLPTGAIWRRYLLLLAFSGVAVTVGSGVLTFGVLKTEFKVGALSAGIALLSSFFFFLLRRLVARRPAAGNARSQGVLVGGLAEFLSRSIYALTPSAGGLGFKALLDGFAVPLKGLFGENIQRAEIERLSRESGASFAEISLFQEARLWLVRVLGCAGTGLAVFVGSAVLAGAGAGIPSQAEGAKAVARLLLGLAAPAALLECFLLRAMARRQGLQPATLP